MRTWSALHLLQTRHLACSLHYTVNDCGDTSTSLPALQSENPVTVARKPMIVRDDERGQTIVAM